MKNLTYIAFIFIIFYSNLIFAQVGIGTVSPDQSSILDVSSTDKGMLLPRLTTVQRDAIANPSNGLLIYNISTSDFNYFNSEWKSFSPSYKSVNSTIVITTASLTDVDITGMTLAPSIGIHSVSFESQISNIYTLPPFFINSNMLLADFFTLYNQLLAFTPINSSHAATFGSGETITPGRYEVASAASVVGDITLDGQGDPNAVFIFHSNGTLNFNANSTIILINGASAENIFWLGEGAVGVGADSIIYGNLMSHGAVVAVGANCAVTGRLITNAGAISFGPGICSVPNNVISLFNYGSLKTIVVFTGSGAITNTGSSVYNGNLCTGAGTITGFATATVNGIIIPASQDVNINSSQIQSLIVTFSLYQNNILIPSSTKNITCNPGFSNISLSGIATINDGDLITIKWKTNAGILTLGNRVLTSIRVNN